MKIVLIGGTGHIGTYLVPRLVSAGHEVIVITRGNRQPYQPHPAWQSVQRVQLDRSTAEKDGSFGPGIRALKPDVVMDMVCFTLESAQHIVDNLRGAVQLFAHCGTVWIHGFPVHSPIREDDPRAPLEEYGIQKSAIERYLLDQARRTGFPAVALHPGHIVGPGWLPVAPTGCHDPQVFARLARGEEVALPNLGLETLHHVHADDVAQGFYNALTHWNQAIGESFHLVSPAALTLRGYAQEVAAWFGQTANLRFLSLVDWKRTLPPDLVESAIAHITHSTSCSISKAARLLEYAPRYSSLEAVHESVDWLIQNGQIIL
jgi:nucleoside-diphosphate-sugar epimerase